MANTENNETTVATAQCEAGQTTVNDRRRVGISIDGQPSKVTLFIGSDDESSCHSVESERSRNLRLRRERAESIRADISTRRPLAQEYLPSEGRYGTDYLLPAVFNMVHLGTSTPAKDYALSEQVSTANKLLESGKLRSILEEDSKYSGPQGSFDYVNRQEPIKLADFVSDMGKTASEVKAYNEFYSEAMDPFWETRTVPQDFMECEDRSKIKMRDEYLVALTDSSAQLIRSKVPHKPCSDMTETQQYYGSVIRENAKSRLSHYTDYDLAVRAPSATDEYGLTMTHKELGEAHAKAFDKLQSAYETVRGQVTDGVSTITSNAGGTAPVTSITVDSRR